MREGIARDSVVNHVNSQMAKYNSSHPNLVDLPRKRNSSVRISMIELSSDRVADFFVAFKFFYHLEDANGGKSALMAIHLKSCELTGRFSLRQQCGLGIV